MKKKITLAILVFLFGMMNVKAIPADAVAEINGTYYKSLSAALKSITDNTKTTITLVKDRQENITIPSERDIVLDLNDHTLTNNGEKNTVITNNGTLEVKNGTITSNATSGMINNNKDAILIVNGGTYTATGTRQVIYNNGGTATITGNADISATTSERAAVHNLNNGKLTITSGTIKALDSYAVYNDKGTLNIGTKNDIFNQASPVIEGATYGVIANNTFNFYDGIIKGGTYHVGTANSASAPTTAIDLDETKVNDIEEFSEKELKNEGTYKAFTYKLDNTNRIKITFDPTGGNVSPTYKKMLIGEEIGDLPIPTKIDNMFDGWYTSATGGEKITSNTKPSVETTYYAHWIYVDPNTVASVEGIEGTMSLKDAFAIGGKIRLEKDVIISENLFMNKNSTLDLNGHTISLENNKITITEEVTITDNSVIKTGKITSNANFGIIVGSSLEPTNAHLIVKGGTIEGLGDNGAIYNFETVEIDGGTVQSTATTDYGYTIYNLKNLIIKSGTVYSTNGRAVQVYENATFTMDGGLVKTDAIDDQALQLYGNCTATINGGVIEALGEDSAGIAMFKNTELIVNGGTIIGEGMAVAGNGNEKSSNANITVNGGNLISTGGVGMYLPQRNSTTTINGGYISGLTGIELRASNLIVNGGVIEGTSEVYEVKPNSNGTTTKGAAIAISQHTTKQPIDVVINDGNLKAQVPLCEVNPLNNPPEAIALIKITVKHGDFESTGDKILDIRDTIPDIQFITGGTYTYDPSDYVEEGYGAAKIAENQYIVTRLHNITIDSSSTEYVTTDKDKYPYQATVDLNIKERMSYHTIIEVKDIDGNIIDVTNNKFIMPDKDVTVKVSYKKIINPRTGDVMAFYVFLAIMSSIFLIKIRRKGIV